MNAEESPTFVAPHDHFWQVDVRAAVDPGDDGAGISWSIVVRSLPPSSLYALLSSLPLSILPEFRLNPNFFLP